MVNNQQIATLLNKTKFNGIDIEVQNFCKRI